MRLLGTLEFAVLVFAAGVLDEVKPDAGHVGDVVAHGKGAMPPYHGRLTAKQISDVAAYVAQATA